MTAAAQFESALSDTGSQSSDGTAGGLFPITAETVQAENVGLSCEGTTGLETMIGAAQVGSTLSEGGGQSVGAADGSAPITAENMHVETVSLSGVVTVGLVSMIAEAQVVSPTFETMGSRMLIAPVGESANVVQTCAKVVSLKTGETADVDSTDCSKTGPASNKRKARRNALKKANNRKLDSRGCE